jgi:aryl-alcohol dehydrogenase-like predicted oxidoreductase
MLDTQDFRVVSKLPPLAPDQEIGPDWVRDSLTKSLAHLRRNSLWGVLLHRPEDLLGENGDELMTGLQNAKNDGVVTKVGVSIYDPSDLGWILERMDVDLVQCPLNVFDRRLIEGGWLTLLKQRGIEVHARSVFLQGTLLVGSNFLPLEVEPWRENFIQFETWSSSVGATLLEAALAYPLAQEGVDKLIVGVTSEVELTAILNSAGLDVSEFPDFHANDLDLINPVNWLK